MARRAEDAAPSRSTSTWVPRPANCQRWWCRADSRTGHGRSDRRGGGRAVQIPVTVKTRLGWCASDADPVTWCQQLEQVGAQGSPSMAGQESRGSRSADWHAIKAIKDALSIPVIANGDINSPADALRCLELTGADGVMVGRGTMGAPWLAGQIEAALSGRSVPPLPVQPNGWPWHGEQLELLVAERGHSRSDRQETHGVALHGVSWSSAAPGPVPQAPLRPANCWMRRSKPLPKQFQRERPTVNAPRSSRGRP